MSDLARQAVRGTLAVGIGNGLAFAVSFAGGLYLMEAVEASDFGLVGFAVALLSICSAVTNWGFSQAATHRQRRVDETFATYLVLRVVMLTGVLCLVAVVGLAAPGLLASRTRPALLAVLAAWILLEAVNEVPAARLARHLRFGRIMLVDTVSTVIATLVAVVLAALGVGVWALVANRVVYGATRLAGFVLASVEPMRAHFHATDARWLLRFGRPLWLGSLATTWVLRYDDLIVGSLRGSVVLGYYDRAYGLALRPLQLVTGVLTRVSFPLYARLQDDRERLSEAFRVVSGTTLRLAAPMAVGMAVAMPDFLAVMGWSAKWGPMVSMFRWLLVYTVARPLLDDAGGLLTAVGRPKVTGHTLVAQAAALLVVCPPLTWWRGAEGAAASVGLVVVVGLAVWYIRFLPRVVDIAYVRLLLWPLLSVAAAGGAGFAIGLEAGWLGGAVRLAVVATVYVVAMVVLDRRQTLSDLRALRQHALGNGEARG